MKFKITPQHQKGFIGPIGDDLPSLIPIVVSLLLFFTIFAVTLNTYNAKNALINQQTSVINVARQMRGESLILDYAQFADRCAQVTAKSYGYNFMIGVYPSDFENIANAADDFADSSIQNGEVTTNSQNFIFEGSNAYLCGYKRPGSSSFADSYGEKRKNYSIRFYPVAVQTQFGDYYVVIPAVLTMVVWQ